MTFRCDYLTSCPYSVGNQIKDLAAQLVIHSPHSSQNLRNTIREEYQEVVQIRIFAGLVTEPCSSFSILFLIRNLNDIFCRSVITLNLLVRGTVSGTKLSDEVTMHVL